MLWQIPVYGALSYFSCNSCCMESFSYSWSHGTQGESFLSNRNSWFLSCQGKKCENSSTTKAQVHHCPMTLLTNLWNLESAKCSVTCLYRLRTSLLINSLPMSNSAMLETIYWCHHKYWCHHIKPESLPGEVTN